MEPIRNDEPLVTTFSAPTLLRSQAPSHEPAGEDDELDRDDDRELLDFDELLFELERLDEDFELLDFDELLLHDRMSAQKYMSAFVSPIGAKALPFSE